MKWIYLSPHLDDAIYSCGGLIWEQIQSGQEVEIWTICAADPPEDQFSPYAESLHQDWGLGKDAIKIRRDEDRDACQILGALPRYLSYLDCIYRKAPRGDFYYQSDQELFGGLDPGELTLIDTLTGQLQDQLPLDAQLVAPLGIGNHVDHDLTRKAASRLEVPLYYYADYPYAMENEGKEIQGFLFGSMDWKEEIFPVSEVGILHWGEAARTYQSQTSIFWENESALKEDISEFSAAMGGVKLWKTVEND